MGLVQRHRPAHVSRNSLGARPEDGRFPLPQNGQGRHDRPGQGRVVLGKRFQQTPDQRSRTHPRLEPPRRLRRVQRDEKPRRQTRAPQRQARLGRLRRRHARIPPHRRRCHAHPRRHHHKKEFPRRLRAQHVEHRPPFREEGIRHQICRQSLHLRRRARPPHRPRFRLPGPLPLPLLGKH